MKNEVKEWYENSYRQNGINAQRRYPNEELLRFLGVNFFNRTTTEDRKTIKVLEIGCGSCANLWMIAREGFDAYGLDLSSEALVLGNEMLKKWDVQAKLHEGNCLEMPYLNSSFDVVVDVLSMCYVRHDAYLQSIQEVYRVLKKDGLFFSYTISQNSDDFKDFQPAYKLDAHTLNGIYKHTSPFVGNHYPFHFWDKDHYRQTLINQGFSVDYLEVTLKSYFQCTNMFEYLATYATK